MTIEHLGGLFLTFAVICILSVILFVFKKHRIIVNTIKKTFDQMNPTEEPNNEIQPQRENCFYF